MVNCTNCRGRGKVMGIGFMMKDCPVCKGSGKIDNTKEVLDAVDNIDKRKKNKESE